ncbi:MAG: adenosylhomocysteinase [Bacillaceae bacterium G1]|nr:adenosylhomocysteinase [Bacillota bacterium]OJF17487.1 MAG: adenosylhomocysteinase [Bacillaceae bacterium G1]
MDGLDSVIRDPKLAATGQLKIAWAADHMPVLTRLREQFEREKPFRGTKVGICLHLEAKTAYLAQVIQAGGAQVAICGSNPLSTQDDVAAALAESGVTVYATHGPTPQEFQAYQEMTLRFGPDYLIDDGGDLVGLLHERPEAFPSTVKGGCEETTTGILRLKALEKEGRLRFPMVAVNDALCKHLFDNRYGTGQSVWDGINRTTNLVVAGKTVIVAGYGWCGKGVAMRAKGLGANVIVTEVDPIKAIEAHMDGFQVMPMEEAVGRADYIVTVTGNARVVTTEHFSRMKDGAILANAGHFDVEVDVKALEAMAVAKRRVRQNIDEYQLADGRKLYLLAEGRLVNLAAGDGHPAEIMDMSFALQALSLLWLMREGKGSAAATNRVVPVPAELDRRVAWLKLESLGIRIDALSEEQVNYLSSWRADSL